jgi:hypothetical protein
MLMCGRSPLPTHPAHHPARYDPRPVPLSAGEKLDPRAAIAGVGPSPSDPAQPWQGGLFDRGSWVEAQSGRGRVGAWRGGVGGGGGVLPIMPICRCILQSESALQS